MWGFSSAKLGQLQQHQHLVAQVKKILPFEGVFTLGEDLEAVAAEPLQDLLALLDGFCIEAKGPEVVQSLGRGGEWGPKEVGPVV